MDSGDDGSSTGVAVGAAVSEEWSAVEESVAGTELRDRGGSESSVLALSPGDAVGAGTPGSGGSSATSSAANEPDIEPIGGTSRAVASRALGGRSDGASPDAGARDGGVPTIGVAAPEASAVGVSSTGVSADVPGDDVRAENVGTEDDSAVDDCAAGVDGISLSVPGDSSDKALRAGAA